ncbi:M28 family metallopeptidase [Hymenobacter latericus]|uniref:M28 family metallopeptidase n=1 Tax=Hymenobacter sp. YIM 151858-1 TaxID=2987688 RepID=UPI002227EAAA|nr:M28 family peptidase [Hymenobacter sp. YIM 151858-1]UYZ57811.1 M28 family peptidase [Hymenobacter sp. YIM 151858-1]
MPRCRSLCYLGAALLLGLVPKGAASAQDMQRVRQTVAYLASPKLHGRGYVRHGERKAAQYIRRRFAALKLQPLAPDYFQPFQLPVNTFPGKLQLTVGKRALRSGEDFIAEPASGSGKLRGPVAYLDTLIFTNEQAGYRFLADSLRGRILVLRQRDAERIRTLPAAFERHLASAAARIVLVPDKLTASVSGQQAPQIRLQVLAAHWPKQAAAGTMVSLDVAAKLQPAYATQNVVGMVRGSAQPDSFLVVSAHYDHLGRMGKRAYFPGANDNASGTAMLLELAAYYTEHRPRYSVAFLAFGAEEAGLVGSRYFVQQPLVPLSRIRFLLNLDLEGTGQAGATVVNARLHEPEYQTLVRLNQQGNHLPALAPRGPAANSDHYPFSEAGVPAFFVYLRGTPTHYHDVHDRAETLPLSGFAGLFKLATTFLNQLQQQR